MAVTRWKSSISTAGTICAPYYADTGGTAYMLMQGMGSAYKLTAGTAVLAGGSVNVTTSLSVIKAAVASCAGTPAQGIYTGTIPLTCVFNTAAGTLAIVHAAGGTGITGTAYCAWQAVGY